LTIVLYWSNCIAKDVLPRVCPSHVRPVVCQHNFCRPKVVQGNRNKPVTVSFLHCLPDGSILEPALDGGKILGKIGISRRFRFHTWNEHLLYDSKTEIESPKDGKESYIFTRREGKEVTCQSNVSFPEGFEFFRFRPAGYIFYDTIRF